VTGRMFTPSMSLTLTSGMATFAVANLYERSFRMLRVIRSFV